MNKLTDAVAIILGALCCIPLCIYVYLTARSVTGPEQIGFEAGIFQLLFTSIVWLPFLLFALYLFHGVRDKSPQKNIIPTQPTRTPINYSNKKIGYVLLLWAAAVWVFCFYKLLYSKDESGIESVVTLFIITVVATPLTLAGLVLIRK